jgi:hypothetical protein
VRVKVHLKHTVLDLLQNVQTQHIDAIEYETTGMCEDPPGLSRVAGDRAAGLSDPASERRRDAAVPRWARWSAVQGCLAASSRDSSCMW